MKQSKSRGQAVYRFQVTIPAQEATYLHSHPSLSASGLLTEAIRREAMKEKEFKARHPGY